MTRRIILFLVTLFCLGTSSASAQQPDKTVHWRMSVKMISPTEGVMTVKATINPGWHMYGTSVPKGGPSATVLDFSQCSGIELLQKPVASPAPVSGLDPLFNMQLSWWEGVVSFKQKFKVKDRANSQLVCNVKYISCNNQRCSMPVRETLKKNLPK